MKACAACASALQDDARYCPSCGTPIDSSLAPTRLARPAAAGSPGSATSSSARRRLDADAAAHGRFLPGIILGERYRMVGLLGRGGMGEVYRADDLKLGQPVALKFLPEALAGDPGRLERFYNEVRITRQISHPNVCRVYDVSEIEGHHFLSMEMIDGEDLASLLRRIGRLPEDKAVEIARQICAGLSAAHERGVLHRDLKPSNIMVDGRGRARLTDFGLAGLAEGFVGEEIRVGTPAYMAPEQLEGKEVTVRSDLYSLGLVLYELFTGKEAFSASVRAEMARTRSESLPASPSSHIAGLDPAIERAILRCLEPDPAHRPASATGVAAALPGGDPLADALAAGETPSPEMVAASGGVGAIRPRTAWAALAVMVAGLAAGAWLSSRASLLGMVRPNLPPAALEERVKDVLRASAWREAAVDQAGYFAWDQDYLHWVEKAEAGPDRWSKLAGEDSPALLYWYRQSPQHLNPVSIDRVVRFRDPPLMTSGMVNVALDTQGRLVLLMAVPPQVEKQAPHEGPPEPDWSRLFSTAGLEFARFTEVPSRWTPLLYAETRRAWEGAYANRPETQVRVEAASYRGRAVYLEVVAPWTRADRMQPSAQAAQFKIVQALSVVWITCVLVGAILLARRNLRQARGDRRGAFRIAFYVLIAASLGSLIEAHHADSASLEYQLVAMSIARGLFNAGMIWLMYLALEPIIRRRWPDGIVSWTRLLAGRFRDPLIGRDLLVGAAAGSILQLIARSRYPVSVALGLQPPMPVIESLAPLEGVRPILVMLLDSQLQVLLGSMIIFFLLCMSRMGSTLHRQRIGVLVFLAMGSLMSYLAMPGGAVAMNIAVAIVLMLITTLLILRNGLLALMASTLVANWPAPLTLDPSLYYTAPSIVAALVPVLLVAWGFWLSVGGRPLAGDAGLAISGPRGIPGAAAR